LFANTQTSPWWVVYGSACMQNTVHLSSPAVRQHFGGLESAQLSGIAVPSRALSEDQQSSSHTGMLERLPKWLILVPMLTQWLWLSAKYRSITLPSSANPSIVTGGMVGEGKMDYFHIMGEQAMAFVTPTACVTCLGVQSLDEVLQAMAREGIDWPVVVKPNLGWCGFGVRKVDGLGEMRAYLRVFPKGEQLVIQDCLDDPGEAGIFYMRHPDEPSGHIIGMLLRQFPRVVGDGVHTVADLMAADARACRLGSDGASEPGCDLAAVPAAGEVVRLATVASTRVGGLYRDGSALVTQELTAEINRIASDMKDFYVGRFDVKYTQIEALRAGHGFRIIEVNGAGSEAVHAWDPELTLRQAFGMVFAKQRRLFAIGDAMRQRGHAPVGLRALAHHHFKQQALIGRYPPSN
jgi:CBS domain-containing protein